MKSFNVRVSFNMEAIAEDAQDAIRMCINRVSVPGHTVADFNAEVVNSHKLEGDESEAS